GELFDAMPETVPTDPPAPVADAAAAPRRGVRNRRCAAPRDVRQPARCLATGNRAGGPRLAHLIHLLAVRSTARRCAALPIVCLAASLSFGPGETGRAGMSVHGPTTGVRRRCQSQRVSHLGHTGSPSPPTVSVVFGCRPDAPPGWGSCSGSD